MVARIELRCQRRGETAIAQDEADPVDPFAVPAERRVEDGVDDLVPMTEKLGALAEVLEQQRRKDERQERDPHRARRKVADAGVHGLVDSVVWRR